MSTVPATLLIVDDEVQMRTLLDTQLLNQGYYTLTSSCGAEALTVAQQHIPDLILLDIKMPGMDGYEVARQLKSNSLTANIPIIMLSEPGDQSARISGLEAGAEDFLSKPVSNTELWVRVRNQLRLKAFGDFRVDPVLERHVEQDSSGFGLSHKASTEINRTRAIEHFTALDIEQQQMQSALRDAVRKQALDLVYQPKIGLADGQICGVEALLRWYRPGLVTISPGVFVPVLESLGLISEVGQWVIDTVCRQIANWQRAGLDVVPVAVNVSAQQLLEGDLIHDIQQSLGAHRVDAKWLEVELTESSLMVNTPRTIASLLKLKEIGINISIDDFGTGYSSLASLVRFPIDKLKIDISYIREITRNPQDAAIARTIIELARSLDMKVIAEGVETRDQLAFLSDNGCDQLQGFLFCRPLPARELEPLLREPRSFI